MTTTMTNSKPRTTRFIEPLLAKFDRSFSSVIARRLQKRNKQVARGKDRTLKATTAINNRNRGDFRLFDKAIVANRTVYCDAMCTMQLPGAFGRRVF